MDAYGCIWAYLLMGKNQAELLRRETGLILRRNMKEYSFRLTVWNIRHHFPQHDKFDPFWGMPNSPAETMIFEKGLSIFRIGTVFFNKEIRIFFDQKTCFFFCLNRRREKTHPLRGLGTSPSSVGIKDSRHSRHCQL